MYEDYLNIGTGSEIGIYYGLKDYALNYDESKYNANGNADNFFIFDDEDYTAWIVWWDIKKYPIIQE